MAAEPILAIPEHIAALPEEEQGPVLVQEIIARKAATNTREKFFQQLVWGEVLTDGHGNTIPRAAPAYWESLKSAVVSGGGVEYTRSLHKPDTLTVGGREMMTHQSGIRVGGRRAGKAALAAELFKGTRAAISWLDEYVNMFVAMYHDPYQEVRDLVARSTLTPEQTITPEVVSMRWPGGRITVN